MLDLRHKPMHAGPCAQHGHESLLMAVQEDRRALTGMKHLHGTSARSKESSHSLDDLSLASLFTDLVVSGVLPGDSSQRGAGGGFFLDDRMGSLELSQILKEHTATSPSNEQGDGSLVSILVELMKNQHKGVCIAAVDLLMLECNRHAHLFACLLYTSPSPRDS